MQDLKIKEELTGGEVMHKEKEENPTIREHLVSSL
jgi:hypothetical protein